MQNLQIRAGLHMFLFYSVGMSICVQITPSSRHTENTQLKESGGGAHEILRSSNDLEKHVEEHMFIDAPCL